MTEAGQCVYVYTDLCSDSRILDKITKAVQLKLFKKEDVLIVLI